MEHSWVVETPADFVARMEQEQEPADDSELVEDDTKLARPGFGLPLNWFPKGHFPVLLRPRTDSGDWDDEWHAATLLIREACMLKLVDDLTNKPEWWRKIRNPEIVARWKTEALAMDWRAYRDHADFTPNMADACFDETRREADLYEKTGLIPIFEYSIAAIKSDKVMSEDMRNDLVAAVKAVEDVPDDKRDWHPGSDGKVLDLVHPSPCPLVYGRTRVLPEKRVPLQECFSYCDLGDAIPVPDPTEAGSYAAHWSNTQVNTYSTKFQWLPCDVALDDQGNPTIDSYINNLHPVEHAGLYPIIQRFIKASLPAWDVLHTWPDQAGPKCSTREICEANYECRPSKRPLNDDEEPREEDEEDSDKYEGSARAALDEQWFDETHPMDLPDAYVPPTQGANVEDPENRVFPISPNYVKTSGFFHDAQRIQVITKLASIHLTPPKPTYDGGSWHIEGQLNEHICAIALFYYSSHNITPSRLSFRVPADAEGLSKDLEYEQHDVRSIDRTLAMRPGHSDSTLQDVGSVVTTQGRAVFFPSLFQHRIEPFELADRSQPGHRKILALFLVDPAVPVVSTANVLPQQRHWWKGDDHIRRGSLPELADMVLKNVDYFIDEEEAKKLRGELMAERTMMQDAAEGSLNSVQFNFCEH